MPDEVSKHLTKIRDKDGVVELKWWTPNGNDREAGEFPCKDKPTDAFVDAMQALAEVGAARLHPVTIPPECFTVTTVSLFEGKAGNLSVIISGSCKVDSGGFGLNTPRLHQPVSGGDDETEPGPGTLTPDQWALVAECAKQAHLYLNGDRVQRGLGLEDGGDNGEEGEGDPSQLEAMG